MSQLSSVVSLNWVWVGGEIKDSIEELSVVSPLLESIRYSILWSEIESISGFCLRTSLYTNSPFWTTYVYRNHKLLHCLLAFIVCGWMLEFLEYLYILLEKLRLCYTKHSFFFFLDQAIVTN